MKSHLSGVSRHAVVNRKIIMPDGTPRYLMERRVADGQHVAMWFCPRKEEMENRPLLAHGLRKTRAYLLKMKALGACCGEEKGNCSPFRQAPGGQEMNDINETKGGAA